MSRTCWMSYQRIWLVSLQHQLQIIYFKWMMPWRNSHLTNQLWSNITLQNCSSCVSMSIRMCKQQQHSCAHESKPQMWVIIRNSEGSCITYGPHVTWFLLLMQQHEYYQVVGGCLICSSSRYEKSCRRFHVPRSRCHVLYIHVTEAEWPKINGGQTHRRGECSAPDVRAQNFL